MVVYKIKAFDHYTKIKSTHYKANLYLKAHFSKYTCVHVYAHYITKVLIHLIHIQIQRQILCIVKVCIHLLKYIRILKQISLDW